ncbi:MAG: NAD(P)H-hydrate dehydratase [Ignavibacteria bacterium]|nr:NAD(P)H-hydrate dehydratase [Ignavibacteria bacterium]
MIKVTTSAEIRKLDHLATEIFNIPSLILMENAAIGVVDFISDLSKEKTINNILILCGHGNNGGDGFAIARHLTNRGYNVCVVLVGDLNKISGDAKINFDIIKKISSKEENLKVYINPKSLNKIKEYFDEPFDLIIDALLGTGLNSEIREPFRSTIKWANEYKSIKLSVDIPTGLSSDNGKILGEAFSADYTLTMGLPKVGLLINDGPRVSGKIEIVDISYPDYLSNSIEIRKNLIEEIDVYERLPKRPYDAHKYSVGKVFAIAGSAGLTGAAKMSCEAALISGCGGVLLLTTQKLLNIYAKSLKEVMTYPLKNNNGNYFVQSDFDEIKSKIDWADVLMIGPGLGQNEETQKFLKRILLEYPEKKKVIDADGLNLLANFINDKNLSLKNSILTPHLGEFARLTKKSIDELKENIFEMGSNFAKKYKSILVLKGAPTIIFDPDGNSFINSTGNSGMATVGMGDVLTGIISSFYAQGLSAIDAAITGVFLHGLAGDIAAVKKGKLSLISSDVIKSIPKAIKIVEVINQELD